MMSNHQISSYNIGLFENKILIVDDAAINRELIASFLRAAGYNHIYLAVDGKDALDKVHQIQPDLLILDLVMPNIDGTQVIKILRENPQTKQLPILVQTAISDPDQRIEAWNYGATDVITKPIHRQELLSRVKVHLENSYLIRELKGYQKLAKQEIARALDLQESLLPSKDNIKHFEEQHHIKIDSIYIPCHFLSGDMWGMYQISANQLGVWICDFSGKGISASLYTLRLHTLINEYKSKTNKPGELISLLNERLVETIPVGQFCTILIGVIDLNESTFTYVSASSTHPIIYDRLAKEYIFGESSGIPLGIVSASEYEVREMTFKVGQSLILYSDLLWEEDGGIPGVSFVPEKFAEFANKIKGNSVSYCLRQSLNKIANSQFCDDLTLVEIQR